MKKEIELRIKFSGEAGDGIITVGTIFMETLAKLGCNVSIFKTFPSTLRGGYSMSLVTASSNKIYSPIGLADVLISFNVRYLERDLKNLEKLDILIIDSDNNKSYSKYQICQKAKIFYNIPFSKIALEHTGSLFTKNIVALGVTSFIFNIPIQFFNICIEKKFKNKERDIVNLNLKAVNAGYRWIKNFNENN